MCVNVSSLLIKIFFSYKDIYFYQWHNVYVTKFLHTAHICTFSVWFVRADFTTVVL